MVDGGPPLPQQPLLVVHLAQPDDAGPQVVPQDNLGYFKNLQYSHEQYHH